MGTTTVSQEAAAGHPAHAGVPPWEEAHHVNVGRTGRIVSGLAGAFLAVYGINRKDLAGGALAALGGLLVYRGASGHCVMLGSLGVSTAGEEWLRLAPRRGPAAEVDYARAVCARHQVTVARPPEELYRFWRDFTNLPRFMQQIASVTTAGERRSHWKANAPAGMSVEWDAVVETEVPNERIEWKSVSPAAVPNTGAVHFRPAPGGRGTEVTVELVYQPPAGQVGHWVAKAFGSEPGQQLREDLRRFKQMIETGEFATIQGQPRGR